MGQIIKALASVDRDVQSEAFTACLNSIRFSASH